MRVNMRIIEAVLQALYYDTCIVINPKSIKAHYELSTKTYRDSKQRAVQWVASFVENNAASFADGVEQVFDVKTKRDDLADALIMVLYYLDTYSNQLNVEN